MPQITVLPKNNTFSVASGVNLYRVLSQQGIQVNAYCGGKGTCGKCKVGVIEGGVNGEKTDDGFYLACKTEITGDLTITIPYSEDAVERKSKLHKQFSFPLRPRVNKFYLSLPGTSIKDQSPDWERLVSCLPDGTNCQPGLELVTKLPDILRVAKFEVTAVVRDNEVIAVEKGDTTSELYGVAFDIGTTSVVAFLQDLSTGETLAIRSTGNPQRVIGADVISRIEYINNTLGGSAFLQETIISALNELIDQLLEITGVERKYLYEAAVAGNTTMHHLLLGINPRNIALSPFIPAIKAGMDIPAKELGLKLSQNGNVHVLPNIAGFVGSDTVGAILSSGIHNNSEIRLLIDIGTNGEVALGSREGVMVCSTAAGPAFEGAQIRFGMRAADGAVEGIKIIEDTVECKVIGDTLPIVGICGSGLIQGAAELLTHGIIGPSGKMLTPEEAKYKLRPALAERVQVFEDQNAFLLIPEDDLKGQKAIYITQSDIRELQLAKGALAAGIRTLMNEMNITVEDIEELLLAGAFGSYIDKISAQTIGLIPPLTPKRIRSVGNAAGMGAVMVLLSRDSAEDAQNIAINAKNIELSSRSDFQDFFIDAMFFPADGS